MSAVTIVLFLPARVSPLSVVVEKKFPPWFESTPTVKKPKAVVRPWSHVPSFGGHCCPGVSRPVPADGDSSSPRSGSILPLLLFNSIYTSDGMSGLGEHGLQCCTVSSDVTVTCAYVASRLRFSTYRLTTVSSSSGYFPLSPSTKSIVFCQGLFSAGSAGIETAFFKFCNWTSN